MSPPATSDSVSILFGSQTGTAEEVAWDLARDCRQRGFRCRDPFAIGDLDIDGFRSLRTAIFVVATTGQGDPPVNMRRLWQELTRASLPPGFLAGMRFAIFGLGDSRYREFNHSARKLHARLLGLGARCFHRLGLGDEQHDFGLEQELDPWVDAVWAPLSELCPPSADSVSRRSSECRYVVEEVADSNGRSQGTPQVSTATDEVLEANIMSNLSLCSDSHTLKEQDVRNVRLSLPPGHSFVAGDVLVVWPRAEGSLVKHFVEEILGMQLQSQVLVRPVAAERAAGSGGFEFPLRPLTLQELFTSYVDVSAMPSRYFFHILSLHTDNELHRTKLAQFASRTLEAKDALYEYCKREKRSAAEVMYDFWSAKPPLAELLSALPPMRPRRYSIASRPQLDGGDSTVEEAARFWVSYRRGLGCGGLASRVISSRVARGVVAEALAFSAHRRCALDLCVAVVNVTTKTGRRCKGLCSNFLRNTSPGDMVRCVLEPGSLALPPLGVPLIMVCPGTGLSPCRALIQQRHLDEAVGGGRDEGMRDLLFLGFRHEDGDFLYGEEWRSYSSWLSVHVAFSRDDPDRKVYVQDKIEEAGAHVCRLLDAGARIFVCGRSHPMPSQVFAAFEEVLQTHRGLSADAAAARLRELQRSRRYVCDTWG